MWCTLGTSIFTTPFITPVKIVTNLRIEDIISQHIWMKRESSFSHDVRMSTETKWDQSTFSFHWGSIVFTTLNARILLRMKETTLTNLSTGREAQTEGKFQSSFYSSRGYYFLSILSKFPNFSRLLKTISATFCCKHLGQNRPEMPANANTTSVNRLLLSKSLFPRLFVLKQHADTQ